MAPSGLIGQRSRFVLLGLALALPHAASGLQLSSLFPVSSGATAGASTDVTGVVLNGETHQPISRVLVRLADRTVLTNHDGVFSFPQAAYNAAPILATKPGFFAGLDMADSTSQIYQLSSGNSIVLLLYPEAILTGTVTDASGEGLPNLTVLARRSTFNETGHHWRQAEVTRTKSDGRFRLAMMAGDYSIQVRPTSQPRSGSEVFLPVSIPAESSSIKEAMHLNPGEVSEIHVTPESRKGYEVRFAPGAGARRGFPRLVARGNNGLTIPLSPRPSRSDPDTFSVILPSGTYLLSGTSQGEGGSEEAETTVTVPEHDIDGVELHFSKTPALPVEVSPDPGSTSDNAAASTTPPTAQSLGLSLISVATSGDTVEQSFQANMQRNQTAAFSVPTGTYRLHGRPGGAWFVTQASCGGTDLLTQNLVVAPGMGGVPIRIVASNQTASVSGTLTLAGQPTSGWVYLVSTGPSATPVIIIRAGTTGNFSRSNIPSGTYRVVGLERRIGADFENPATLAGFLDRVQSITLNPGGQQTVALAAVPVAELTH